MTSTTNSTSKAYQSMSTPKLAGSFKDFTIQTLRSVLNGSVPTPETADIPLTLQLISSLKCKGWAADVRGAFTQSTKGLRKQPLYAEPPPEGIPGIEDSDVVIELLCEIYGLISGPPGWLHNLRGP